MALELFLDQGGKVSGPFSPNEVRRMVREGKIGKEDLIRKNLDGKAVRAANVKGLFPEPGTELSTVKVDELAPIQDKTESENAATAEILSKTWSGLVATASVVASGMSKLRPKSVSTAVDSPQFITPVEIGELTVRSDPPQPLAPIPERATDMSTCPFCGEDIRAVAKKCKHCGEILDVVMRAQQQPQYHAVAHAPPVINIVNTNTANAVQGGYATQRWSPFVAVFLSFLIPGLGQLYKGQFLNSIVWFVVVVIGYVAFVIPGVILHFCCLIGAGSGDPYR